MIVLVFDRFYFNFYINSFHHIVVMLKYKNTDQ